MKFPWQIAKERFEADLQRRGPSPAAGSFGRLVAAYIAQGAYVISNPSLFVLACPVRFEGNRAIHDDADADTWFVHLAALPENSARGFGRCLFEFLRIAPYALPWAAWHRRGSRPLRRYRWDDLEARVMALDRI